MQYIHRERVDAHGEWVDESYINAVLERFPEATYHSLAPDKKNFVHLYFTMDKKHFEAVIAEEAKAQERKAKAEAAEKARELKEKRDAELESYRLKIAALQADAKPEKKEKAA